jgi:coproporphyrinogen III oxidase-like Fe-S oxidoreductase
MLVENFLTQYLKFKNKEYLRFASNERIDIPPYNEKKEYLLYVHIPFCEKLCPYCSFNRYPFKEDVTRKYYNALRSEINLYKETGYNFSGVYIGGGTPTILMDELINTMEFLASKFTIKEFSVETNPNHLNSENIKILQEAGVNRLSVGVQSFDDSLLKTMERYEKYGSGSEIIKRLELAKGRFDTLNIDMIFNFPGQTLKMVEKDVKTIIDLGIDQVTFYPLMVSTATKKILAKKFGRISYLKEKKFYNLILNELQRENFIPASAWCFSQKSSMIDEYIVNYEDYAGVGSGSFGYIDGKIFADTFSIEEYISLLNKGYFPIFAQKVFSKKEQIRYDFLMKLFGKTLDIEKFKEKYKNSFIKYLWPEILFFKITGGIKKTQNNEIVLTQKGLYLWVIMMREFFTGVNNFRDQCRAKV